MRVKLLLAVLAFVASLILLYRYGPPVTLGISDQSVESALKSLGYEHCGTYTLNPVEGFAKFSKTFYNEAKCFFIVKRPGGDYMFKDPKVEIVIEPPSRNVVYKYSVDVRFFRSLNVLPFDEDIRPYVKWGVGVLNETANAIPVNELNAANDDLYAVFSYKPENGGFPVKVILTIMADVIQGKEPSTPSPLESIGKLAEVLESILRGGLAGNNGTDSDRAMQPPFYKQKLASKLGIKDIKALMSHVGYELCGEFTARDTNEIQSIRVEVEIDPNEGRACYILIHPPPGRKAFLLIRFEHETITTDNKHFMEYIARLENAGFHGGGFLRTPLQLVSAFDVLGIGRIISSADVVEPYSERGDLGGGRLLGAHDFGNNAPILIFFAYKGDPETFGGPLNFKLKTHILVEFRIIPAKEYIQVN